ncbi:MAG: thioredoxin family protein [Proteobacteria bacterium]|nr:thioredoxin family protein [Pseudomonadota bacterium]
MARTPSNMLDLGTYLPEFNLPNTTNGELVHSKNSKGHPVLVMFICNHCPFVIHVRAELARLGRDYLAKGLNIFAISSNDVESHPDDSPEKMKIEAKEAGYLFPYLYDQTQNVAKSFRAACTPDFYLFDANHKLVYRGQLDDSRPSNGLPVTGKDLRFAIDALLEGRTVSNEQKPSLGCNIKWKEDGR